MMAICRRAVILIFLALAIEKTCTIPEEPVHIPVGERKLITCEPEEDVAISWLLNDEPYTTGTPGHGSGSALLAEATVAQNGSVLVCLADDGETGPVAVKRWIILVEAPPTLRPSVMVAENGSYAVSLNLSESSEAYNTTVHVEVREADFTAIVNGAGATYLLPASVCSSVPTCMNCSATLYARNIFGTGDAVEVVLRKAAGCIDNVDGSSDVRVAGVHSFNVTTNAEVLLNVTIIGTDGIIWKIVIGCVTVVIVIVLIVTLVVCFVKLRSCNWRAQISTMRSKDTSKSSVAMQATPDIDNSGQTPESHKSADNWDCLPVYRRKIRKTSTTRILEVVVDQPRSPFMPNQVREFQESNHGTEANTSYTVQVDVPLASSTPTRQCPFPSGKTVFNTSDSCAEGDSELPLLNNKSNDATPQYGLEESLHDENDSPPHHVFPKVSSGNSLLKLDSSVAVSLDI